MITKSLDIMKSCPGIWVIVMSVGTVLVETTASGVVYQLTPETLKRDGELRPDGWYFRGQWQAIGPLARTGNSPLSHR